MMDTRTQRLFNRLERIRDVETGQVRVQSGKLVVYVEDVSGLERNERTQALQVRDREGLVRDRNGLHRRWEITNVKTADYCANPGELVLVDPSSGTFSIMLPALPVVGDGAIIALKNVTSAGTAVSVTPETGDTIDGSSSAAISGARAAHMYVADVDRRDWLILSAG